MSIRITQIELSEPLKGLRRLDYQYSHVWALVRLHGEPLGWLKIENDQLPLTARQVGEMVARDHTWPIYEHSLRQAMGEGEGLLEGNQLIPQTFKPVKVQKNYKPATALVFLPHGADFKHLLSCLQALQKQDHPDYEILLACNGSIPNGLNEIAVKGEVRLISGSNAFYQAIQQAQGEIISLTGAMALPDKGWLRGVADAADTPRIAAITGPLFPHDMWTQSQINFQHQAKRPFWFNRYYNYDQLYDLPPENFGTPLNASFRRDFLLQQATDDFFVLDFGLKQMLHLYYQALKQGYMVGYEPKALVWERYPEQEAEAHKQVLQESQDRAELLLMEARWNPRHRKLLLEKFRANSATRRTLVHLALKQVQQRLGRSYANRS